MKFTFLAWKFKCILRNVDIPSCCCWFACFDPSDANCIRFQAFIPFPIPTLFQLVFPRALQVAGICSTRRKGRKADWCRVRKPVTVVNGSKLRSVTVVKTCVTTTLVMLRQCSSTWPKCQRFADAEWKLVYVSIVHWPIHFMHGILFRFNYFVLQLRRIWHDNRYEL